MKVALSASFWQNERVAEILKSCDHIFTSNPIFREIEEALDLDRDKIIPLMDCTPQTQHNIRTLFPTCTVFYTFGDFHKIDGEDRENIPSKYNFPIDKG